MTQTDKQRIARAIERAHARGIRLAGTGTRKSDGRTVYAVTSGSEPNRWHLVTRYDKRLVCDCLAGQRGQVCQHRGLVYEHLSAACAVAR